VAILDRIDAVFTAITVLIASAVAMTVGLLTRFLSQVLVARAGGSLTGFEVGDAFPEDETEAD
jgi:hypothetical protein